MSGKPGKHYPAGDPAAVKPDAMNRDLGGAQPHFRPLKRRSNPYRMLLWFSLILGGIWLAMQWQRGNIEPLFLPTPTPTRTANSLILEGDALFDAGNLEGAIAAYQGAISLSTDSGSYAQLARIQTYSSSLLTTDAQRYQRLKEALEAINHAIELNPDDVNAIAVRALVLDWYASNPLVPLSERQNALNEAEREAARAYNLELDNPLALAFYAEILVDQQKWTQAQKYIEQPARLEEEMKISTMDVHRVYGYVWESLGEYPAAIGEYKKAVAITPNLTFLYVFIGRNYLRLELYDRALEYFERAVNINKQLKVQDPVPYLEIARTYVRKGEFFAAALNAEKALRFDPTNPNTYGQLGSIYVRARNYEGAQPAFRCAVRGCSAAENQTAIDVVGEGYDVPGLPLTSITVAYYYVQYGSVLAALSRPTQNYCPEALEVLNEVRAAYSNDTTIISIIEENEAICQLLEGTPKP